MWLRFVKETIEHHIGDICFVSKEVGKETLDREEAIRLLNPDGDIFEDAAPEDIISHLAAEDNVTFEEKEKQLQRINTRLVKEGKKDLVRKIQLGQYVDAEEVTDAEKEKEKKEDLL